MLVNDITDRYHDWPMTEAQFSQFVQDKYDNVDAHIIMKYLNHQVIHQLKLTLELTIQIIQVQLW